MTEPAVTIVAELAARFADDCIETDLDVIEAYRQDRAIF